MAIELAAARVNLLTLEQLAERLKDRLRLLTGGSRTYLTRQQTLRALIDWSYELLSRKERALLERLAVFVGGWTLEAAEAICSNGEVDGWETLDLLTQLTSKSLIGVKQASDTAHSQNRYTMLETIRQYATEKLEATGKQDKVHQKHLEYYLNLLEEVEPKLKSREQEATLQLLEKEHNNLREALKWALDSGQIEAELRLAGALVWFWFLVGDLMEGREWLEKGLALASQDIVPTVKAKALYGIGLLVLSMGISDKAFEYNQAALKLYSELGDESGRAYTLYNLAGWAWFKKDYPKTEALAKESLAIFRRIRDKYGANRVLSGGFIFTDQLRLEEATEWLKEALVLSREIEDKVGEASVLTHLGQVAIAQGDYEKALDLAEQSVGVWRELSHNRFDLAEALTLKGKIGLIQGNYEQASELLEESLRLCRKFGNKNGVIFIGMLLGQVLLQLQEYNSALELFQESLSQCPELGETLPGVLKIEGVAEVALAQGRMEQAATLGGACEELEESFNLAAYFQMTGLTSALPNLRKQLDNPGLAQAWAEGRTMTLEQALAYAAML